VLHPPAEVAHLFGPYFRPATNSTKSGLGLGLGLYIVSEIAKAHHGTATASAQGDELTFTVRIPRQA
jgi:signal transduction histidine kinase